MLFSYIRTAFRSLVKNKTFSVLNILGLALGMACCMIIFQYVTYEKSYDKFHPDYQDIYRVQYNYYQNGNTIFECAAAVPAVAHPACGAVGPVFAGFRRDHDGAALTPL